MTHELNTNRRDFLQLAGTGTVASLACVQGGMTNTVSAEESQTEKKACQFTLALASYTLRKFDLDQTIAMTKRVGLSAICLKSFHLPMESTSDEITAVAKKVKEAGLTLYGGGVIGMKNQEQIDQAFEYAKTAGMTKIVAAPIPEMLPAIDVKVKEYDIQVCIHNHGPGDKHFATPVIAYEQIKSFDKRIGLCHDIGHTIRYGKDAIAETEQCADRIFDFHVKDVTEAAKAGHATPCGRGVIDLPKMLRTLVKIGYSGFVAFEYEEDPTDPLAGLAESVGYVRGVLDTI
jgi:inosose dehydratase